MMCPSRSKEKTITVVPQLRFVKSGAKYYYGNHPTTPQKCIIVIHYKLLFLYWVDDILINILYDTINLDMRIFYVISDSDRSDQIYH